MPARRPEEADELFMEAMNSGDLQAALALYEQGGSFTGTGQVASGIEAIRQALSAFLAMKPRFTAEAKTVAQAGDIALTSAKWSMTATGPDGNAITMTGHSAEVVRRQADGTWLFVIDAPFGLEWGE